MDLQRVLARLHVALADAGVEHALIGGLAMGVHVAPRATQDVDLLVEASGAERLDLILHDLGYRSLHRSEDVGNYASDDPELGRVDALFARRRYALEMLARARPAALGSEAIGVPVVDPSDLIGLKVQASSNDPSRRRSDLADIERLLRDAQGLDLDRVRTYFSLFDREKELDALLADRDRDS